MSFLNKLRRKYHTKIASALRDIGDIETMFRNAALGASSSSLNLIDFIGIVHNVLEDAGIPFAISGAFAVAAHGTARQTTDLDIVVHTSGTTLPLADAGFIDKGVEDFQKGRVRIHKWMYQGRELDVLDYPKNKDFVTYLLSSAEEHELVPGKKFKFVSAEGIIVTKLLPFRRKDQMDIDSIKKTGKKLDLDLIKSWCIAFGIIDRYSFMEEEAVD